MRRRVFPPALRRSVVGLDMSMTATAACALPLPWNHDLAHVRMLVTGEQIKGASTHTPWQRAMRIAKIAHDVKQFCVLHHAEFIAAEDYAYGAGGQHTTPIIELGGVVKNLILSTFDLGVERVSASSARKTLLQHVPRLGRGETKPWVVRNVKRLGGPAAKWTDDECDAFVIANAALELAGGTALSFPGE